jgi:hypothetical protein
MLQRRELARDPLAPALPRLGASDPDAAGVSVLDGTLDLTPDFVRLRPLGIAGGSSP